PREAHGEPEARSTPLLALAADAAPHQLHELTADGEPQARASVAAAGRAVGLRERLEELADAGRGDAGAGVAHFEAQREAVLLQRRHAHAHRDLAVLRELDGV